MGFIIAFSGVSGSGKTTAAKLLVKRLRDYKVKAIYHHEFDYLILGPIKKMFNKLMGTKQANNIGDYVDFHLDQGTSIHRLIYFLAWLDHMICHFWFKLKRGIIVNDRWFYDRIVCFESEPHSSIFLKKLYSISPRPDVIFLLDVSPKISYLRRKTDSRHLPYWAKNLEYYEVQRSLMLKLAQTFNYNKILDSSMSLNEIVNEIINFLKEHRPEIMVNT